MVEPIQYLCAVFAFSVYLTCCKALIVKDASELLTSSYKWQKHYRLAFHATCSKHFVGNLFQIWVESGINITQCKVSVGNMYAGKVEFKGYSLRLDGG